MTQAETTQIIDLQSEVTRPLASILFPDVKNSDDYTENNSTTRAFAATTGATMLSALEQAGLIEISAVKQYVEERRGES